MKRLVAATAIGACCLILPYSPAPAYEILGTGTASLIGNDLTDIEDDGDPEADIGYDAIFDASDEVGFGGGEFAFNVFDNRLGPGNDKWCCGVAGGIFEDSPQWVSAQLPVAHFLTNFTISSANDTPDRDPIYWALQGSNDGADYTDIYVYDEGEAPWDARLQVIEWQAGEDFPVQTTSYEYFRMATYDTLLNPTGAYFQIGEIELFGTPDGEVPPIYVAGEGTIGAQTFDGARSNEVFGPEQPGVPGWHGRIVTYDEHLLTLSDHSTAEIALEDYEGVARGEAYPAVDMAGGGGTFPANYPYPNGVANGDQDDFAVQVVADVIIPPGEYTIGFGSDDGGKLKIPGVEFEYWSDNNTSLEDDEIRHEGVRGHGWTVGYFQLGEQLETTITAEFFERGGGDSFEVAVIEGEFIENANPANGWELLSDGVLGWSVTTTGTPLLSADLSAAVSDIRAWEFDVDGDSDSADQFVVPNPDSDVYTTILDLDGVTLQIAGVGALANGDAFEIIVADQITGTPIITSRDPGQTWSFDAATGFVMFGAALQGDYNGNGELDAEDLDLQAAAIMSGNDPPEFDLNGDGVVDYDGDRVTWLHDLKGTWAGDADLDGLFDSSDFVTVFIAGKYETGEAAGWAEGDWNADGLFDSGDFVAAFIDGGYEIGAFPGAVKAVPEPSSLVLALLSVAGLLGLARRRS